MPLNLRFFWQSGTIDVSEFRSMVYDMGYYFNDAELAVAGLNLFEFAAFILLAFISVFFLLVSAIDTNLTGKIDREEFQAWWSMGDARFAQFPVEPCIIRCAYVMRHTNSMVLQVGSGGP